MASRSLWVAICAIFIAIDVSAQVKPTALQQFRDENPGARIYGSQFYQAQDAADEAGGGMTAVYGTILSVGTSAEDSAWNHVNDIRGMLGDEIGNLVPRVQPSGNFEQGAMYNRATGKHKFSVLRFDQQYQGVPVFRSGVGFLIRNEKGYPLVMSGITVKDLSGAKISVPRRRASVNRIMLRNVRSLMSDQNDQEVERSVLRSTTRRRAPIETSEEQYVIYAGGQEDFVVPQLAVQFVATQGSVQTYPDYHKYMVVASVSSGEILHQESLICYCADCLVDIDGNVSGRATDGLASLECDDETPKPLAYADVEVGNTTVNADVDGNFTIPNDGSDSVEVTSHLRGTYFEVFDQAAGDTTPSITQSVNPPGPANFLHNPTEDDDLMTANVNCYYEANLVRDFVLNYEPAYPVINNQTRFEINTNIDDSCNAFYNGSSINFFQRGGGCNNTAFSDVVYHEYGHHLINVTGNGQGQMGEGSGDTIGMIIQDDPILGQGFSGNCNAGIRNAQNNIQYPCEGGIHMCGQMLSGCFWNLMNELRSTEPSGFQDVTAELFLGMLIVRGQMDPGQTMIAPDITVIVLELDDDDGDIGNGTPHYDEVDAAFSAHNMDPPPLNLLTFEYPNGRPDVVAVCGGMAFTVEVVPLSSSPVAGSGILNVDFGDGQGFQAFPMTETSTNVYEAIFPNTTCGNIMDYFVSVDTTMGSTANSPSDAPDSFFRMLAADSLSVVFSDNGNSDPGYSVTGDATDGQWDRGTPVGGGDRGDPAVDADGSGQCWLTDNVDGNSDVDGGSTILTTNTLNALPGENETPVLMYHTFFSNDFGAGPMEDVMVVEISNDGGASWVTLETIGPTGPEASGGWFQKMFRISDIIQPTNNMRLRFNASDLTNGSVVEAGVDGIEIVMAQCVEPEGALGRKLLDGVAAGGGLAESIDCDDVYFFIDPTPTSNPAKQIVDVLLIGETDVNSPDTFDLRVEASISGGPSGDVIQVVQLWNETDEIWETLDSRIASNSDSSITVPAGGNVSRFVHPITGEVTARLIWESPGFAGAPFFWSVNLDQFGFIIE